jgi:hypothetical protein
MPASIRDQHAQPRVGRTGGSRRRTCPPRCAGLVRNVTRRPCSVAGWARYTAHQPTGFGLAVPPPVLGAHLPGPTGDTAGLASQTRGPHMGLQRTTRAPWPAAGPSFTSSGGSPASSSSISTVISPLRSWNATSWVSVTGVSRGGCPPIGVPDRSAALPAPALTQAVARGRFGDVSGFPARSALSSILYPSWCNGDRNDAGTGNRSRLPACQRERER